jgi:hypothetical protein
MISKIECAKKYVIDNYVLKFEHGKLKKVPAMKQPEPFLLKSNEPVTLLR